MRTLRSVVDLAGQAVSAADRLYLTSHFPTLIVWGTRDRMIPVRHARAAHAAIPHSRLEIFENVGHYPQCDAPERFGAVLADFIASTEPAHLQSWREVLQAPAARGSISPRVSEAEREEAPVTAHRRVRQRAGSQGVRLRRATEALLKSL